MTTLFVDCSAKLLVIGLHRGFAFSFWKLYLHIIIYAESTRRIIKKDAMIKKSMVYIMSSHNTIPLELLYIVPTIHIIANMMA